MSIDIRVKRTDTEDKILNANLQVGELAFSTSTCTLWSFNGLYKCIVGRALVDTSANLTSYSGVVGRFFYALDTQALYVHDGTEWATISGGGGGEVTLSGVNGITTNYDTGVWYIDGSNISTVSGVARKRGIGVCTEGGYQLNHNAGLDHYTDVMLAGLSGFDEETVASVGDFYIQVGETDDIVYNTGGVYGQSFYWEVTYDTDITLTTVTEDTKRGVGVFSSGGYSITHNLGLNHFTSVIPAGMASYSEYDTASIGSIYIQIGETDDIVYNTGDSGASFYWELTSSGSMVGATVEQLATVSGAITGYIDQQLASITNLIPSVTTSGNIMGSGVFAYVGGYSIEHNLNTVNHYVAITPASTVDFDEYLIASIGNVYVKKGLNTDIVYHTGGSVVDGLTFDWEIILHGLRLVEEL